MRNRRTTPAHRLPVRLASALAAGILLVGIAACDDADDEREDELDEEFDQEEEELENELDQEEEELENELEEDLLD